MAISGAASMALANNYTDLAALGLSGFSVNDELKSVTFTTQDGVNHTIHFNQPTNGKDGLSPVSIEQDEEGHIKIGLSDGSSISSREAIESDCDCDTYSKDEIDDKIGSIEASGVLFEDSDIDFSNF